MSTNFEIKLNGILSDIKETLLDKNKKYGDSALNPIRIFNKDSADVGLRVRMDDKLSRIKNGDVSEDSEWDLLGYMIMYQISKRYK